MAAIDDGCALQVTAGKLCVLPSENVPTAVNCWVVPRAIEEFPGVTAMESNTAGRIVSGALELTAPEVATIFTGPWLTPVATPEASTVAIVMSEELHWTEARSAELPSLKIPVAVNCAVAPIGSWSKSEETAMSTSEAGFTVNAALPETEP